MDVVLENHIKGVFFLFWKPLNVCVLDDKSYLQPFSVCFGGVDTFSCWSLYKLHLLSFVLSLLPCFPSTCSEHYLVNIGRCLLGSESGLKVLFLFGGSRPPCYVWRWNVLVQMKSLSLACMCEEGRSGTPREHHYLGEKVWTKKETKSPIVKIILTLKLYQILVAPSSPKLVRYQTKWRNVLPLKTNVPTSLLSWPFSWCFG